MVQITMRVHRSSDGVGNVQRAADHLRSTVFGDSVDSVAECDTVLPTAAADATSNDATSTGDGDANSGDGDASSGDGDASDDSDCDSDGLLSRSTLMTQNESDEEQGDILEVSQSHPSQTHSAYVYVCLSACHTLRLSASSRAAMAPALTTGSEARTQTAWTCTTEPLQVSLALSVSVFVCRCRCRSLSLSLFLTQAVWNADATAHLASH
jgi:hypothetical protein